MQLQFNHPVHLLNYARVLMRSSMQAYASRPLPVVAVPHLSRSVGYYFLFETMPDYSRNMMLYSVLAFAADGEVLFEKSSSFPVSLWRYQRQGLARTATMIEGVIVSSFRRNNIPLRSDAPFVKVDNNLYQVSIHWQKYERFLKSC